jgi:2,3,4,5-tetrahydropyridine-2,6-dicarboxylate N-succinyltransferase
MPKPDVASLETTIERAFEDRERLGAETGGETREAVEAALDMLDRGEVRVSERRENGDWHVNQWLKKAVLLSFRLNPMEVIKGGPGDAVWGAWAVT